MRNRRKASVGEGGAVSEKVMIMPKRFAGPRKDQGKEFELCLRCGSGYFGTLSRGLTRCDLFKSLSCLPPGKQL